ncbi:hypothetical protein K7432_009939 [Basidiobolus ranarum]|uniref:Cation-transporting P-type ATPase N-terminal domain-containing protein n=1 Tax=Basidiobolus ranarum TaxID=34480 RepID=A0ABR2WPH0_9FUNG
MDDSFTKTAEQVLTSLEPPYEASTPLWELILEQFKDQLVIILLFAAAISFVLAFLEESKEDAATAYVEPIVILLILIANATVGVVQESNAEKAIEALKEYSPDEAKVLRDGSVAKVHATELVPGDIIEIAVGDKVPADCRLLELISSSIRIDQAILTGESSSVNKQIEAIKDERAVKQDQVNILFSGTTVVLGKAKAVVVQTGSQTAIGDIHQSITSQISEKTPLKKKLDDFGDFLAKAISVICILVWIVNIRHFNDPSHHGWLKGAIYYFKIAVALAVAAIPEGLAVVITTCLALGTKKMAQKNAIVRSLPSVETLGCTSVICSDKTGTLTTNQMSIQRILTVTSPSGELSEYHVEGTSYAPIGHVKTPDGKALQDLPISSPIIQELSEICALCNDSRIAYDPSTDNYSNVGEPTEAALKVLVEKLGTKDASFNQKLSQMSKSERVNACNNFIEKEANRVATFEFSRDRKSMSVLIARSNAHNPAATSNSGKEGVLYVKGAPESILERCTHVRIESSPETPVELTSHVRNSILGKINEYGGKMSLRCLGLASVSNLPSDGSEWDLRDPNNS